MGDEDSVVDLRSDTVTRPSAGMRRAIAEAEVGDDTLGDDPTTRKLEETVAVLLGKERALFFPSGIMANQTALAVLAGWGGEVLLQDDAHILVYEEAAAAALAGVQLRPISAPGGPLSREALEPAIRAESAYTPRTRAIAVENTHLASGGRVVPPAAAAEVGDLARDRGLRVHLDGARLWHAAAATGSDLRAWADHADTVMVSLSKGLGCPVGSVLAGESATMDEAWRVRRRFGGAMRQSGILAAAGLYALEHHRAELTADHARAKMLAKAFTGLPGVRVILPETNVVLAVFDEPEDGRGALLSFLRNLRILMLEFGTSAVRAVTHRDVDDVGIARAVRALDRWREMHAGA